MQYAYCMPYPVQTTSSILNCYNCYNLIRSVTEHQDSSCWALLGVRWIQNDLETSDSRALVLGLQIHQFSIATNIRLRQGPCQGICQTWPDASKLD